MGADASSTLLMRAQRADHGVRNYRYDQTWRGIPIFGEGVVVSEDGSGNVRKMFGNLVSGLDQDIASTTPRLGKAAALVAGKRAGLGNSIAGMLTQREQSRASDGAVAGMLNSDNYLGRPMLRRAEFDAKLKALTLADVNAAIARHFKPAMLSVYTAGDFANAAKSPANK